MAAPIRSGSPTARRADRDRKGQRSRTSGRRERRRNPEIEHPRRPPPDDRRSVSPRYARVPALAFLRMGIPLRHRPQGGNSGRGRRGRSPARRRRGGAARASAPRRPRKAPAGHEPALVGSPCAPAAAVRPDDGATRWGSRGAPGSAATRSGRLPWRSTSPPLERRWPSLPCRRTLRRGRRRAPGSPRPARCGGRSARWRRRRRVRRIGPP